MKLNVFFSCPGNREEEEEEGEDGGGQEEGEGKGKGEGKGEEEAEVEVARSLNRIFGVASVGAMQSNIFKIAACMSSSDLLFLSHHAD